MVKKLDKFGEVMMDTCFDFIRKITGEQDVKKMKAMRGQRDSVLIEKLKGGLQELRHRNKRGSHHQVVGT